MLIFMGTPKLWKKIFTNIMAVLLVISFFAGNIANEFAGQINSFLGISTTRTEHTGEGDGQYARYFESAFQSVADLKAAGLAKVREVENEGAVLLKNDSGALPLSGKDVSLFGATAVSPVFGGTGSGAVSSENAPTYQQVFTEAGFNVVNKDLLDWYVAEEYGRDFDPGNINEASWKQIQKSDAVDSFGKGETAIFVIGRVGGEANDLKSVNHDDGANGDYLRPNKNELAILEGLKEMKDAGQISHIVLLLNSANPISAQFINDDAYGIDAALWIGSVGQTGLYAVADILSGAVNPSGSLPDTWWTDNLLDPAMANFGSYTYQGADQYSFGSTGRVFNMYVVYQEGIYVGYRYTETRYEDKVLGTAKTGSFDYDSVVAYPFGYGLSYSTFEMSNMKVEKTGSGMETSYTVTVDVKNTGGLAGKDVVQVYVQSPYTDYDKQNKVEKSAVQLVGFGKSSLLAPGSSETVTVTFDKEQLKAYDYTNAKTFILDAGDYYITAAHDAHNAVNNVLAAKGFTTAAGMTEDGDAAFASLYTVGAMDSTTYATSAAGAPVTNRFDFMNGGYEYLSRSDWQGTWPATDGEVSGQISTWGNEINGSDGKSYTYAKTISAEDLAKLDGFDSLNPADAASLAASPVYGAKNGLQLIDLRGKDYDDPLWDQLLDQLKPEDYQTIIATSGYGNAELKSVGKPFALDQDAATGLTGGGTGVSYCGTLVLAQTWNQELAARYGEMIGNQAVIGGCVGWYAPAMNIHRLPFSGRNNEYYSEDGYLSGAIAAATSRGAASKGMYTFIKHFALNDQENHRGDRVGNFGVCTWSNEQAVREIYLLPFQMCVENDPVTLNYVEEDGNGGYRNATREFPAVNAVMTAFNRIGYTWTGGCYPLITEVLRNEWGFNGFAITDNANTGSPTYMNAYQMIEAGGDGALTTSEYAVWKFDKDNAAHYTYGREAMHHVLYAVANSKVMSGLMPGSTFVTPMTLAEKLVVGIDIGAVVIIAALGYFIYRGFRKPKKREA